MKWTREAEEAVSKVPFFVRKRVRKRVEEEAAGVGAGEITLEHVQTCQQRFLNRMEEEVKGFRVETCFGPSGCPNRAVAYDDLPRKIEDLLSRRNLKSFLKGKAKGPLKLHHEFRVSISDCPNACSRPQIADIGLIGARRPNISRSPAPNAAPAWRPAASGLFF
jgi:dissimilatory sulfite reductase (desulfoviridin) alpha/beta subunit